MMRHCQSFFFVLLFLWATAPVRAAAPIRAALIVQGPDEAVDRVVKNQLDQALNLLGGLRAIDAARLDDKAEGWTKRDFPPLERPKWARELHVDVLYLIRLQPGSQSWRVELEHYDTRLGKSSAVARLSALAPDRLTPALFDTLLTRFKLTVPVAQKSPLERLLASGSASWVLRGTSLQAVARAELEQAQTQLDQALTLAPEQPGLLLEGGDLKALRGDYAGAVAGFSAALEQIPAWPEALYLRALAQAALGRYDLSQRDLESAYRIKPDYNPELAYLLGKAALENQPSPAPLALGYFKQAVLNDPAYAPGYQAIGQWYLEQHINSEALKNFDLGLKLNPDSDTLYSLLTARSIALTSSSTRRASESVTDLTRAIGLAPTKPLAWYLRGLDWAILGNCPKAHYDWNKACGLGQTEACRQHCP